MNLREVGNIVHRIGYKPGFSLKYGKNWLQVECVRRDIRTGEMGVGRGGRQYFDADITTSGLVRLAFSLLRSYEEHETREHFTYEGRAVFGPNVRIDALWEAAREVE